MSTTPGPTLALMKEINARRVHGKAAVRQVVADRFRVDVFIAGPRDKILNKDTYWKIVEQRERL